MKRTAILGAAVLSALSFAPTWTGAPTAQAGSVSYVGQFSCSVVSSTKDATGNLLTVTVTMDPSSSDITAWNSWLAAAIGAPVHLGVSRCAPDPKYDSGSVSSTSGSQAVVSLDVPGGLSFDPQAGSSITVTY